MLIRHRRRKQDISQFQFILQKLSQPAFLIDKSNNIVFAHLGQTVGSSMEATEFLASQAEHMFEGRPFLEAIQSLETSDIPLITQALSQAQKGVEQKIACTFSAGRFSLSFIPLGQLFTPLNTLILFEETFGQDFALRSFSLFLTNIGHELRTPLNAILGFSELLTREIQKKMDKTKCALYIEHIHKSSQNLYETLLQLIDLAHLSIQDMPLQEVTIDLRLLLDHVLRKMEKNRGDTRNPTPASNLPLIQARVDVDKLEKALTYILREAYRTVRPTSPIEGHLEKTSEGQVIIQFICKGMASFESDFLNAVQTPLLLRDNKVPRTHYALDFIVACALADLHDSHIELESRQQPDGLYLVTIGLVLPPERVV